MLHRRELLVIAAASWPALLQAGDEETAARIAAGGVVVAFRHSLAPGTFDPPGFRVDVCSTQRNLNDEGRAQAQRIGKWFAQRRLAPAAVRSSPWCRCLDTARLAFDRAEAWPALGSPRAGTETVNQAALDELRRELVAAGSRRDRFEVWVTHQFVLSALIEGGSVASGEGLLLQASVGSAPTLLGRLRVE